MPKHLGVVTLPRNAHELPHDVPAAFYRVFQEGMETGRHGFYETFAIAWQAMLAEHDRLAGAGDRRTDEERRRALGSSFEGRV